MLRDLIHSLTEAGVDFIIVGGLSARIQGAAMSTDDLDIMPDPEPGNLVRLAAVLSGPDTRKKIGATALVEHPVVDAMEFRTETINSYMTPHGAIDVLMELPEVGGYASVQRNAKRYSLGGDPIVLADIDDVIASKVASDRGKDWIAMPALREASERLRQFPDEYEIDPALVDPDGDS